MLLQALEILMGEPDGRGPEDALALVFLKPELKRGNDVGIDRVGMPFLKHRQPDCSRGETR